MRLKSKGLWAVALVLAGLVGGVPVGMAAEQPSAPVVAKKPEPVAMVKVNDQPVTVEDYAGFLQRNPEYMQSAMSTDAGKAAAVRMMVGSRLIHDELLRHPEWLPEKDRKNSGAINAAYAKMAEEKFAPAKAERSEEELYAYYKAHPERFGIPEMVRVSQIQFLAPEKSTQAQKEDARKRAEVALGRLKAGEDFGTVAAQLTENKLARLPRGDLGFIGVDQSDWLHKSTAGLKVGETSPILESPAGYEILMVTDRRPELLTPYANVHEKIIQILNAEEKKAAEEAYMRSLAKTAKIEVVMPELKPLFPNGVFPQ